MGSVLNNLRVLKSLERMLELVRADTAVLMHGSNLEFEFRSIDLNFRSIDLNSAMRANGRARAQAIGQRSYVRTA